MGWAETVETFLAFQCHHGVPASALFAILAGAFSVVSMPPRRSCFQLKFDFPIPLFGLFQCHHGVPASSHPHPVSREDVPFQCHHGVPASGENQSIAIHPVLFQCHHGVPASRDKP